MPELQIANLASSRTSQIVLGGVAGGVLGVVISSKPIIAVGLVAAILAAIMVAAALTHPGRVFVGLVLAMVLIPTYAAPEVGSLLFIPAAALSWPIAGVLAWRNAISRGRIFRPTAIDLTVIAFAVLMYVSLSFSAQIEFNDYLNDLFAWGGPFLAARLLLEDTKRPAFVLATSFALGTALVAPVAVLETLGKSNPFLMLQFNAVESSVWGGAASRLGAVRAEASFGHPIALSMFVSTSALLSLGMAIFTRQSKERLIWLALALLAVAVQALTYSRTGWLILVIGVALLAISVAVRAARRRLGFVIATIGVIAIGVIAGGSAPQELQLFPSGEGGGEESAVFQDSGAYREALLQRALEPGVLHLWGNPVNRVTPAVSATNGATDNAYIILADEWGLIPTFALIGIAVALLISIALARKRRIGEAVVVPIVAFTSLCALFFVAFITQQQLMIWLLIGAASVASATSAQRPRHDSG